MGNLIYQKNSRAGDDRLHYSAVSLSVVISEVHTISPRMSDFFAKTLTKAMWKAPHEFVRPALTV